MLFLGVAVALFFFSLTLLPPVELYCRFLRPAISLLILQVALIAIRLRIPCQKANRALFIATFVFSVLGLLFNAVLLMSTRGKC